MFPELVAATRHVNDVRVLPAMPLRIVSRNGVVLTAVDPFDPCSGALAATGARRVAWLQAAESMWRSGRPWSPEAARQSSARLRAVTGLLLDGFDDEAIGRRLGVSVRTVRRDIADLMREHGVKSRVQLGAALGRIS
jgi:DNA-binding NarL/FixJ family response regulator